MQRPSSPLPHRSPPPSPGARRSSIPRLPRLPSQPSTPPLVIPPLQVNCLVDRESPPSPPPPGVLSPRGMCGASFLSSDAANSGGAIPPYRLSDAFLLISDGGPSVRHISSLSPATMGPADDPFVTTRALGRVVGRPERDVGAADAAHSLVRLLNDGFSSSDAFSFSPEGTAALQRLIVTVCAHLSAELGSSNNVERHTVYLRSPVVVCGDLHGSYADLSFFLRQVAPFGSPTFLHTPLLFLGDFVDRGAHSVETAALLLAWRVLCPAQVVLLRGNHEDPEVNGDVRQYSDGSFLHKCITVFGEDHGPSIWARLNAVFSHLPVACVVDGRVFACHGGIPRLLPSSGYGATGCVPHEMFAQLLRNDIRFPLFETVLPVAEDDPQRALQRRLVRELLWNDPAPLNEPGVEGFDASGFRPNYGRGDSEGIILEFSPIAVRQFLDAHGWSNLIRAHQHKQAGIQLSEGASVVTVFSASNYYGGISSAGACLVSQGTLQLVSWSKAAAMRTVSPSHSPTRTSEGGAPTASSPMDLSYPPSTLVDRHSDVRCFMSADSVDVGWFDGRLPTGADVSCPLGASVQRTATPLDSISHSSANPMRDLWCSLRDSEWAHTPDANSPDHPPAGGTRDIYISTRSIAKALPAPLRGGDLPRHLMSPTFTVPDG